MTRLVLDAERKDKLPPMDVAPGDLSGHRQRPNLSELKAAFALTRLSRAIAVSITYLDLRLPTDRNGNFGYEPEDPDHMAEWDSRVRKAIHRILVCGAVLAGAYNETLMRAQASAGPEITSLVNPQSDSLSTRQLDFLQQYTVCNMAATPEAEEAIFGALSDWLVDNILADTEATAAMADRSELSYGRASYCEQLESDEREWHEPGDFMCPIKA